MARVHFSYGATDLEEKDARDFAALISAAPDLLDAVRPLLPGSEKDAQHFDGMDDEERITITIPIRVIKRAMGACEKATSRRCVDALLSEASQP